MRFLKYSYNVSRMVGMKLATFVIAVFAFTSLGAFADPEIAVAIRYLQAEGESHSQLYLFREDGKLLRQLTKQPDGQVMGPVFAPDGENIVFRIEKKKTTEYWSVEPKGGNLHRLKSAPVWYAAAKPSPYFTDLDPGEKDFPAVPDHYTTPDGTQELALLHENPEDDLGAGFQLRDTKTKSVTETGKMEGFVGLHGLLHRVGTARDVFLMEPPLRVAFFWFHMNSTDGTTVFALDLNGKRFIPLGPNWVSPVMLPGEAAFLTLTEPRYLPIPGSEKTANCAYVERWDSNFHKVRYGTDAAAIAYGASMYRPGGKPAVIVIPSFYMRGDWGTR